MSPADLWGFYWSETQSTMAPMSTFVRFHESLGPTLRIASLGLLLVTQGCGVTLLEQRVEGEAKEWYLGVTRIDDGPDETLYGRMRILAGPGNRLFHVYVTLVNRGDHTRAWNWRRCGFDHGENEYLPVLVMPVTMSNAALNDGLKENVFRGEAVHRRAVFSYPTGDTLPTRLKCGDIVLPLQLKQ